MSTVLGVAAAQIAVGADIDINMATILQGMATCAAQGADLCVFPEAALTGYSPTLRRSRPASDGPLVQQALEAIAVAARQHHMGVVVGAEAWHEGAWHNRLLAYGREGELLAQYDKVHLTRQDVGYYRAGNATPVFRFQGVICGLQICYDARFPEGYRALLAQGVQVVLQGFYGAGSDAWKVPVLGAHLRSRAAESGCFVVAANVAGPKQIVVSQIVDPLGLLLAEARPDAVDLIRAELDMARIAQSEIRADWCSRFSHRIP
ncbi:MAG: carbon-nitrogen hydrolase family protein [Anaerolineae bacterium]|jgi:predicted amidohydrolase